MCKFVIGTRAILFLFKDIVWGERDLKKQFDSFLKKLNVHWW